jgi:predicted transcriptional regulator|nr:MAG TPA: hypothetical protein [Caudoviricetes sp.]
MEDRLIELITSHFGLAFFIGIVVVAALIFFIWWARGMYERVCAIKNLPCKLNTEKIDSHIGKHGEVDVAISKLETSINYMQKSIDSLVQSLQNNNKIIIDPFTQSHSPIAITPKGKEMMERLSVEQMFEGNWSRIKSMIEQNADSKNPYDIQQYCLEQAIVFPENFLQPEEIDKLKTDAYEKGLPLTSYMRVIAVLARDKYFHEHNIDVNEVDRNDPNNK